MNENAKPVIGSAVFTAAICKLLLDNQHNGSMHTQDAFLQDVWSRLKSDPMFQLLITTLSNEALVQVTIIDQYFKTKGDWRKALENIKQISDYKETDLEFALMHTKPIFAQFQEVTKGK